MGDANRSREQRGAAAALAARITGQAADRGDLLEIGFAAFVLNNALHGAPVERLRELRIVYLAGAEHIWSSVMTMLEPGLEETPRDLDRMAKLQAEIGKARAQLTLFHERPQGAA